MKYNDHVFELIFKSDFCTLYYEQELKLALCVADEEYIPIANFKSIFESISDLIEDYPIENLIFDKRKLRTFHQPSMEWYFAIWKPIVKEKGLVNHYKILPEIEWFAKAVEAGKHEIFQKYGNSILNGIDIFYVKSVEEVIEHKIKLTDKKSL